MDHAHTQGKFAKRYEEILAKMPPEIRFVEAVVTRLLAMVMWIVVWTLHFAYVAIRVVFDNKRLTAEMEQERELVRKHIQIDADRIKARERAALLRDD